MATSRAQQLEVLSRHIRRCTKCPLHTSRTRAVPGAGQTSARIMLIGEAPGKAEDEQGLPFVGAAGRLLDGLLREHGLDRQDLFITNIVKCRPPDNRTPRKTEIDTCTSHYLFEQIECVRPELIVLLGSTAAKTLLGVTNVNEVRGRIIERDAHRYLVGYHPAAAFYRKDLADRMQEDFTLLAEALQQS